MEKLRGIYVLIIKVDKDIGVDVGALGRVNFKKGLYAYVGSAQTNLAQRIERHLRKGKRRFWHIDYLLDNDYVKVLKVFFESADKKEECRVARLIGEKSVLISSFGSSDCHCRSHLFHIEDYAFLKIFMREL